MPWRNLPGFLPLCQAPGRHSHPLPPAGRLFSPRQPGSCLRSVWELLPTPSMASPQPGHVRAELRLQRDAEQPQRERKRQHLAGCGIWKQEGNPQSTAPGLQQLGKQAGRGQPSSLPTRTWAPQAHGAPPGACLTPQLLLPSSSPLLENKSSHQGCFSPQDSPAGASACPSSPHQAGLPGIHAGHRGPQRAVAFPPVNIAAPRTERGCVSPPVGSGRLSSNSAGQASLFMREIGIRSLSLLPSARPYQAERAEPRALHQQPRGCWPQAARMGSACCCI